MNKKLYRNKRNGVFGGVCAGLADYFDLDIVLVRLIFVFLSIFGGGGLLIYIIMWIVIPTLESSNLAENEYVVYDDSSTVKENEFKENSNNTESNNYATANSKTGMRRFESRQILGITLMVFGFFFILDEFIPIHFGDYVFPAFMIIVGGLLLWNK